MNELRSPVATSEVNFINSEPHGSEYTNEKQNTLNAALVEELMVEEEEEEEPSSRFNVSNPAVRNAWEVTAWSHILERLEAELKVH